MAKKFREAYIPLEELSKGRCTRIFRCRQKKNNKTYVAKQYVKGKYLVANSHKMETAVATKVGKKRKRSVSLLSPLEIIESPREVYLVYDSKEIDLFEHLKGKTDPLPFEEAKSLFSQMVSSVQELHLLGYAHLDLCLENFLLSKDKKTLCLGDYGLAKPLKKLISTPYHGRPSHSAPEIKQRGSLIISPAQDVYSLGTLMYLLFTATLLYESLDDAWYSHYRRTSQLADSFPKQFSTVIRQMLKEDPAGRPSLEEIQTALEEAV